VTVTDAATGTPLCDAKVTFLEGSSKIEATSCYEAALSRGKYRLRVERRGLVPYEEPFEVTKSDGCGQSVQTMYVALDRVGHVAAAPQAVAAPQNGTVPTPALPASASAAPAAAAPASAAPAPAAPAPPAPTSPATVSPTSAPIAPAPAATAFPDAH
jgi:hypothetical protein